VLSGGQSLNTPFGIFYTPNISPHVKSGIGAWTGSEFANAMVNGVSPNGAHYYPAFPYTSYTRMTPVDVADLWVFLKTLPIAEDNNLAHELPLPFRLRRGLGLWKILYLNSVPIMKITGDDPELKRGQYLVEGLAHCGECHTPRNIIGGFQTSRWLGGGPAPEGKGRIPNITPHASGIGAWSKEEIAYSLESGFTPEFDSFSASMAEVQENMAKLPESDRDAIAAYLKAIPAIEILPKRKP
jgi:mono/diheme cytochrome c family protein